MTTAKATETHPLEKMREKFPDHQISKLPKETKAQADQRRKAQDAGNWPKKCEVCGGSHHEKAVHLDYVGHAALTDRLLDTDIMWNWEPVAFDAEGLPAFDRSGGLWIRLTVGGVSRLGYGHAAAKPQMDPGAREKEVIGDALRNAAMRFGAALDLWHKGDLHLDDDAADETKTEQRKPVTINKDQLAKIQAEIDRTGTDPQAICKGYAVKAVAELSASQFADAMSVLRKRPNTIAASEEELNDQVPY